MKIPHWVSDLVNVRADLSAKEIAERYGLARNHVVRFLVAQGVESTIQQRDGVFQRVFFQSALRTLGHKHRNSGKVAS